MTMKKLTVAAAIAVGIATCSFNNAMAASCDCDQLPVMTGGACPVKPKCYDPCDPCDPCAKVDPCDPCAKTDPCDPCKKVEKKCNECDDCPDFSCNQPAQPACASCEQPEKITSKNMQQSYAYPNAIYGTNNYVGELGNGIALTENGVLAGPCDLARSVGGSTILGSNITGAACEIPVLGDNCPRIKEEKKCGTCPMEINTENSIDAIRKTYVPFETQHPGSSITGAAADLMRFFPDVSENYWASCNINKLAKNDVVVGYPDSMFKPSRNVTRAEFATMLVKGMNMDNCALTTKCLFSDVPASSWANAMIAKAVDECLLKGYPDGKFKPKNSVTRAEALTALAHSAPCTIDKCKAQEILSKYQDGSSVSEWAQIPIAEALEMGALRDFPNPNRINPNQTATRAEIASMLQPVRVAAGYDKNPATANAACPLEDNRQAYVEDQEVIKIPTLKMEFKDQVNAKNAHVGQRFSAKTLESITINGRNFPSGSKVIGKVIEVVRPSGCQKGALKLAFTEIEHCDCKVTLPKQILTAQISKQNTPNPVSRLVTMPFTWAGSLLGIAGRTTGGMLSNLGNAAESVTGGVGVALGETFQGQLPAAGRSLADAVVETVKAPIDLTRTAISGTMGLFQTSGDEFAYLVDPDGNKISAVNPKEHISIAFGCDE